MICAHCKKNNIPIEDMHDITTCDACFDLMMQKEDKDFDVYYNQNQKCFICGEKLSKWMVKNIDGIDRAICWKHRDS